MLRFDVWNSYYEPHFTVDFIYLFSVSDLKIYKLPSYCCFLFLLRWNTHTHVSVKLHWDTEYRNPNSPVQVNCWEIKGLHWWFPIHPLLQLPLCFCFSWASSVLRICASEMKCFQPRVSQAAAHLQRRAPEAWVLSSLPAAGTGGPSHPLTHLLKGFAAT